MRQESDLESQYHFQLDTNLQVHIDQLLIENYLLKIHFLLNNDLFYIKNKIIILKNILFYLPVHFPLA